MKFKYDQQISSQIRLCVQTIHGYIRYEAKIWHLTALALFKARRILLQKARFLKGFLNYIFASQNNDKSIVQVKRFSERAWMSVFLKPSSRRRNSYRRWATDLVSQKKTTEKHSSDNSKSN